MDWFKKHVDAMIVLGGLLSCVMWMNSRFNEMDNRFNMLEKEADNRFNMLEKEIAIIKTVLVLKNIMPVELVKNIKEEKPPVSGNPQM